MKIELFFLENKKILSISFFMRQKLFICVFKVVFTDLWYYLFALMVIVFKTQGQIETRLELSKLIGKIWFISILQVAIRLISITWSYRSLNAKSMFPNSLQSTSSELPRKSFKYFMNCWTLRSKLLIEADAWKKYWYKG